MYVLGAISNWNPAWRLNVICNSTGSSMIESIGTYFLDNRASRYPCRLYIVLDEELVEPMEIDQINVTEEAKHKLALQEEWILRVLEEYENMAFSACWDYTDHQSDRRLYELWHERCERNKDIIFSIIICIIYI